MSSEESDLSDRARRAESRPRCRGVPNRIFVLALSAFIASAAIPGLAASFEEEEAPAFPSEDRLAEAVAQEEADKADEDAWLSSSEATSQREASEYAYADVSASEEEEILRASFPEQLEQLESDPARLLSDVQLDQIFSGHEALVTVAGEEMLLESSTPIRVPDEEGRVGKVDLGLKETDRGYAPANPIVDVSLPGTAGGPIYVGDSGLAISVEDASSGSTARAFGDEDLFFPEAQNDLSLLLSPTAGGVDVSSLLLSRESPEQLRFATTLPPGATLQAGENGGAEIRAEDGSLLANVNPPRALDAQGTEVPVTMGVEKQSLVIDVPHRSLDVAYPVLVDPEVVENWSGWNDSNALNYWHWQWNTAGEKDYIGKTSCIATCWGPGLYVRSKSEFTYSEGSYGRWWFVPQGSTTYIRQVIFGPMAFDPHGCTANQPHGYTGIWNEGGWWSVFATAYPSAWVADEEASGLGKGDRIAFVALSAASKTNIKCGRDYALGGATLYLDDPESPTITSVAGLPSGWVKGDTQITAKVTASDPGLGVQKIRALGGPAGEWEWNQSSCAGTMKDLCASSRTGQISLNTNGLWEGKGTVSFQPYDPTGKSANSKAYEVWVDRLPPTIDLEGQLAKATDEEGEKEVPAGEGDQLSLPTYNLAVEASDATSGTKSVEIFLDEGKSPEPTESPKCSAGKCTLSYQLQLVDLAAGPHVLWVVSVDQAGNTQKRKVEFGYTPATGIKGEYTMQHIPLPDGLDHSDEAESHGPEIAVNVINGNVVYHERDIQVEGRDANLELERSYNSQLPAEKDTRWGHGWSVAQLPELESQSSESPPTEATMLRGSGAMTSAVAIPASTSESPTFDPKLHAAIKKDATGGYEVSYEDGEEENVFDSSGEIQETAYPSGATLNIDYKGEYKFVTPSYLSSFGSYGTGNGKVDAPGDLSLDSQGNIWLLDRNNNRAEKFNPKGEFLTKFGSYGSGNGQFSMPSAIAIDTKGNLWIADTENNRIEEFDPTGKYLSKFGTEGTANGQLGRPEGIAIDSKGNIWVADTYNNRIQEFSSSGTFVKSFGSFGYGKGQFYNPTGIDFGANDTLWVADWSSNRITELNTSGTVLREFGSAGSGSGQFRHPDVVEADGQGRVWVGDEGNDRVQAFSEASGSYITQFGGQGAAGGQFDFAFPMGIASDSKGRLRISDANNDRIQKWKVGEFDHGAEVTGMTVEESDPWTDTDISADFQIAEGLVDSVNVEGGPESDYSYDSGLLMSEEDEGGEASYGYDSSDRLNSIELPNGTVASIEYDALSRAIAVTVDPAGEEGPETTKFKYVDEPRETRVSGGGNPEVIYSIGNDGSVFRWSYAAEPPKFASFGGTLWEHRNSTAALTAGDQSLSATAESAHQIAEVQVFIDGEVVVEEKVCKDDPKTTQQECQQVPLEWVTNTSAHPAGQLNLEVVATDFLGNSVGEKFFVTIPQQAEPEPEAPVEPTFEDVRDFREEFGLDYQSGRSESKITKLIFELLEELELENAVAVWSAEEWGVPLREAEIKELEYREHYIDNDGELISSWGEEHAPSSYAGYYVDHEHGGQIYVGFTSNASQLLGELKQIPGLEAVERVSAFPTPPSYSIAGLTALQIEIGTIDIANPNLVGVITTVAIDAKQNSVTIDAADPSTVKKELLALHGNVPIAVSQASSVAAAQARFTDKGRVLAGQAIGVLNAGTGKPRYCTAGFGAKERIGTNANGSPKLAYFGLTSGHCFDDGQVVGRFHGVSDETPSRIGAVRRRSLFHSQAGYETDAEAIRLNDALVPQYIHGATGKGRAIRIKGSVRARPGMPVCMSGAVSGYTHNNNQCGQVTGYPVVNASYSNYPGVGPFWQIPVSIGGEGGDSGSPLWQRYTNRAVALHTFLAQAGLSLETPLLVPVLSSNGVTKSEQVPGALEAPGMGSLHLVKSP